MAATGAKLQLCHMCSGHSGSNWKLALEMLDALNEVATHLSFIVVHHGSLASVASSNFVSFIGCCLAVIMPGLH